MAHKEPMIIPDHIIKELATLAERCRLQDELGVTASIQGWPGLKRLNQYGWIVKKRVVELNEVSP